MTRGSFWGNLGPPGLALGSLQIAFDALCFSLGGHFGTLCGYLEAFWVHVGVVLEDFEVSWRYFGLTFGSL